MESNRKNIAKKRKKENDILIKTAERTAVELKVTASKVAKELEIATKTIIDNANLVAEELIKTAEKAANKLKDVSEIESAKRIKDFHVALETFSIPYYNGEEVPVPKPIGIAISLMSEDLKKVKTITKEHSGLLKDIKEKKDFSIFIKSVFAKTNSRFKINKRWKILAVLVSIGSTVIVLYKILTGTL